jgi:hypothetical protein
MWKKVTVLLLTALFVVASLNTAQAGWWHHHRVCCQTPMYYAVPQAAPQAAPSNQVMELLLPIFADLVRSRLGGTSPITTPPTTQPTPSTDLAGIKSDIAQIAASLENTNSTLARHGKEIATLRLDVEGMKSNLTGILDSVGSNGLKRDLQEIVKKLPLKTKEDLLSALKKSEIYKPALEMAASEQQKNAARMAIDAALEQVLNSHYGQ